MLKPNDQESCCAGTEDLLRDGPVLAAVRSQYRSRKELVASPIRHSLDGLGLDFKFADICGLLLIETPLLDPRCLQTRTSLCNFPISRTKLVHGHDEENHL